jgi:hypothetical protein
MLRTQTLLFLSLLSRQLLLQLCYSPLLQLVVYTLMSDSAGSEHRDYSGIVPFETSRVLVKDREDGMEGMEAPGLLVPWRCAS